MRPSHITIRASGVVASLLLAAGSAGIASHTPTPSQSSSSGSTSCGIERRPVKTGEDADATKVDLSKTVTTTVAALIALPAPASAATRLAPTETTVFAVQATLSGFKFEADSDYHLVLNDRQGHTMIVEIPSPSCVSGGPFVAAIAEARSVFDAKFRAGRSFVKTNTPVTVRGVGFFDRIHGQLGVAPNGIELHPVLSIAFA